MLFRRQAQLPAQQLRQQRVAQGGEGAGLVEVGADLAEQRFDELVERGGDLRRGKIQSSVLKVSVVMVSKTVPCVRC